MLKTVPQNRADWIRTSDLLTPSQTRYQTALRPELPQYIRAWDRRLASPLFRHGFDGEPQAHGFRDSGKLHAVFLSQRNAFSVELRRSYFPAGRQRHAYEHRFCWPLWRRDSQINMAIVEF